MLSSKLSWTLDATPFQPSTAPTLPATVGPALDDAHSSAHGNADSDNARNASEPARAGSGDPDRAGLLRDEGPLTGIVPPREIPSTSHDNPWDAAAPVVIPSDPTALEPEHRSWADRLHDFASNSMVKS